MDYIAPWFWVDGPVEDNTSCIEVPGGLLIKITESAESPSIVTFVPCSRAERQEWIKLFCGEYLALYPENKKP